VLCCLTGAASGCHLIFPFGASTGEDTSTPRPEQRPKLDGLSLDRAREDSSPKPDSAAPDTTIDPCNPSGTCQECEPLKKPKCTAPCVAPECDDLPDHRDPWTNTCKDVLFQDDFSDWTLGKWVKLYAGGSMKVSGCVLVIDPPTNTTAELAARTRCRPRF